MQNSQIQGWTKCRLGEAANVERGKFSVRPRNDPRYYGGNIPFIQTGDVSNSDGRIITWKQTLNEKGLSVSRLFPKGTIFMSIAANIGDVAIADFDAACPDSVVGITANESTNSEWLFQTLKHMKHVFESLATQNAQKNINLEKIRPVKIDLPPLPEQRKIAAILKAWDEAIGLTESLIAKKQRHKKALMQRLLTGTTRFPQFEGQAWREVHLTDVATVVFSNVDKKTHNDETTVRLCNYMDVFRNDYITDDLRFMEATATSAEIKKFTLNTGDVVFTKDSETADEIAESTVVAEKLNNVICGYHLGVIRPDDKELDGFFLSLLLKAPEVRHQFIRLANGVTRYGLNLGSMHLIKLNIPSVAEQQAIAEVFVALDQEIHLLQTKLAALRAQKRGLMQQLLTGKLRVSVEDEPLTQPQKEQHYG